jgi:hypothetical protein
MPSDLIPYRTLITVLLLAFGMIAGSSFKVKDFKQVKKLSVESEKLAVDRLGFIYTVQGHDLNRHDKDGNLLHNYSNFIAGDITSVDVTDPFKILVYYRDFGQIDILDNTLSPNAQPILLQSLGLELSTLVCRSYNNAIWVYDPTNFEIVRITETMQIAERTGNINQVTGYGINPDDMIEVDNNLYLSDPQTGIIVFDRFGTYFRTIPEEGIRSFQVNENRISFLHEGKLSIYDTRKLLTSELASGLDQVLDVKIAYDIKPQRMYLIDESALYIFENTR